jgi:peptidoglycan/xylan/chitin deacetylase (PgdA/CDA1 family)
MIWKGLAAAAPSGLTVLFFHRVFAQRDPLMPGEPTAADFDRWLVWLKEHFDVLPLDEAVQMLKEHRLPRRAAAITFDDGYRDNHDVAAPLLEQHRLPATFFVTTGYLDGGIMWNDEVAEALRRTPLQQGALPGLDLPALDLDGMAARSNAHGQITRKLKYLNPQERQAAVREVVDALQATLPDDLMMTSEQVRSLARRGFQVGAHTVTHPILTRLDDDAAREEIRTGRDTLQTLLGRPVRLFAYPNGRDGADFDARHRRMAREIGFDAAFSTEPASCRADDDFFALPRFVPWRRDTSHRFHLELWRNQWRRLPAVNEAHA